MSYNSPEQKKGEYWVGHTDNYVTIKTGSSVSLRNEIVTLKVISIEAGAAKGEIV
ncbi:MAG: hypothetical protein V2A70_04160 [Candidatus Omnitrophota bacterium]